MTGKRALFILLSAGLVFGLLALWTGFGGEKKRHGNALGLSALDRVQESRSIRCGYWVFEPFVRKNPSSGAISGIAVDYLERTAARKGLKVIWAKEFPLDQIVPALEHGHMDMFCLPCSPTGDWAQRLDFAGSFGKMPFYLYVSAKGTQTQADLKTARFATIDGYIQSGETRARYPEAAISSLPNGASVAELYDQIKYGKADAILNDHLSALNYMRNNVGVMRRLDDAPLFTKTMYFPVQKGDSRWMAFVNAMTDTALPENAALFDALIQQYGLTGNALTR